MSRRARPSSVTALSVALGVLGLVALTGVAVARSSSSLRVAAVARVPFPAAAAFDYQIGGAYPPPAGVKIVDRDSGSSPVAGVYNVCYINGYQAQTDQIGWWKARHPNLLLHTAAGKLVIDRNWGEPLLDISTAVKRAELATIVGGWIDRCGHKGFQAIEPDNLDSYLRSQGRLTLGDDLAFAGLLAERAHAAGLDIAQKNLAEDSQQVHARGYDFAIAEQCQQYEECNQYTAAYGNRLVDIEYSRPVFTQACAKHAGQYSIVLRDIDVVARGTHGYVDERCR